MPQVEGNKQIYSLLEITKSISRAVSQAFPSSYWITAEIAKLNFYPKSGHCYPDLVEKQNGLIKAQIRANIWSGQFIQINRKFREVTGEVLKDGMKVLFLARVSFHEHYGLALNILDAEPSFTLGEMAREKQANILRLKKEGLFDENKKRHFPLLPKRIAVISVETSKGYHDFLKVIQNNTWGYRFSIHLFPALLQGDGAVRSIGLQLREIAKQKELFDVVCIIRGGGGDVGLNAYDNYYLAKEVAHFPLPVITGIGHSTNETIVQMVAFANKITPTEAGHFLLQAFHNFSNRVETAENNLQRSTMRQLETQRIHLGQLTRILQIHTLNLLNHQDAHLQHLVKSTEQSASRLLVNGHKRLNEVTMKLKLRPLQQLQKARQELLQRQNMLRIYSAQRQKDAFSRLELIENKVQLLKPENVLKRGYSITYVNNKALHKTNEIKEGDSITTQLHKGKIESVITKIKDK